MIGPIVVPVLATGTHVGKTFVTATIAAIVRPHATCLALKPVESGWDEATSDAATIALAAGHAIQPPLHRLRVPISPHLAAERDGVVLRAEDLAAWAHTRLALCATRPALVLVETAGGVCSPLSLTDDNRDLVAALSPTRLVLVVPDRLGALHDARAALIAIRSRTDAQTDVVFSAPSSPDHTTGTNAAELARLEPTLRGVHTLPRGGATALVALAHSLVEAVPPPC